MTPSSKDVDVGGLAIFFCNSMNETKWFFNGGILPRNTFYYPHSHFLTINSIQNYNDGIYTCHGRQGVMLGNQYFVAQGQLHVYGMKVTTCKKTWKWGGGLCGDMLNTFLKDVG